MRRQIITSVAMLPLLFGCSHAAQNWSVNGPAQAWTFSIRRGGPGG